MNHSHQALPDVFSARDLAGTAGVPARRVRELMATGEILTVEGEFVAHRDAVRAVRALALGLRPAPAAKGPDAGLHLGQRSLTVPTPIGERSSGLPLLASTVLHAVVIVSAVFIIRLASSGIDLPPPEERPTPIRLVYLAQPGPGGGGGGGGARLPLPPPKAERKGRTEEPSTPVPPAPEPIAADVPEPPPLEREPLPPIVAPLVRAPGGGRDLRGVLEETTVQADSRGPGAGEGVGSGDGTGLGEGQGSGVGPGSGGGAGGGPYRPGSGVEPPRLLREVKPTYTEQARQLGVEGDVLLEIVVLRDGSVGEVRIVQRLGSGLDQRAVQAVRQWRFDPARRLGTAVDVLVEVAVAFRLI